MRRALGLGIRRWTGSAPVAIGILCVVIAAREARASTIVIESYAGERPADADAHMAILLDELARRGKRVGVDAVGRPLEEIHSRPAVSGAHAEAWARMPRLVESGYQAWVDGRYQVAIRDLSRAIEIARAAPGAIIERADRRRLVGSALVGLALAHRRCGQAPVTCGIPEAAAADALDAARRWMAEVIGSFQERELDVAAYGPEALELYRKVQQRVRESSAGGALIVNVDDAGAMIFVNEGYAGTGQATLSEVSFTSCRVLVRKGSSPGRVLRASLVPGEPTRLDVSWAFEAALHTSPPWVGLGFGDEAARDASEVSYAIRIARLVGAETVIVLSIRAEQGRRALAGAVYGAGRIAALRTAHLALEPIAPSPERLRAMAAYLAGDLGRIPDAAPPAGRDRGGARWRRISQAILGIGALTAVGSSAWYLVSPDDDHTSPTYEDRKTRAVQVFTGGSMSLGVGVYLYLHKTRSIRSTTAATLGLGVSALLAGAMMYASDEDVYSGAGLQRERYRNTAAAGLISGGAGIALSGVGLWLLSRERRDAFVPIVQVAHERGFIGWSGRF